MASRRRSRVVAAAREAARTLGAILVVFAVAEVGLRVAYAVRGALLDRVTLPYVLGHEYGPLPPWVDGVRILEDHPTLLWRGRPNVQQTYLDVFSAVDFEDDRTRLLRQFVPRVPPSIADNPVWEVSLGSEGFRGPELPVGKDADVLRVVCLGDSWTFGVGVPEELTFARRFEGLLRAGLPGRRVEVVNLGVLGYTSLQGLRLLRARALSLEPDLVLIGFAMNDSSVMGYRDRDVAAPEGGPPLSSRLAALLEEVEVYELLRYLAQRLSYEPKPLGERLASAQRKADSEPGPVDYDALEAWTRVSPADYAANVREMIELARGRGAAVVLLYNEFAQESPYRDALLRVGQETAAPVVDASAVLEPERRRIEDERARALDLEPAGVRAAEGLDSVEVVFRALSPEGPLRIAASHPALGDGEPNRVFMRDDGEQGDERAGDGVWSHRVRLEAGRRLAYLYTRGGAPGRWEGLDVPALRWLDLSKHAAGSHVLRPVETFGSLDLKADAWHTNAAGHGLIARALWDVVSRDAGLRARLGFPDAGLPDRMRSPGAVRGLEAVPSR